VKRKRACRIRRRVRIAILVLSFFYHTRAVYEVVSDNVVHIPVAIIVNSISIARIESVVIVEVLRRVALKLISKIRVVKIDASVHHPDTD